jgi:spermidine/putrescine transport system ATP-binding protein
LYVTHDQEEALTMSDRLAVMTGGHFAQIGTPRVLYEEPADAYVADFLGVSNLMDAEVVRSGIAAADSASSPSAGRPCSLRIGDFEIEAGCGSVDSLGAVRLAIRPERVQLEEFGLTGQNRVPAMVERLVFLGAATQVFVRLAPGALLQALVHNDGQALPYAQGTPVCVQLPADALRVLVAGDSRVSQATGELIGSDAPGSGRTAPTVPEHGPVDDPASGRLSAAPN